jgi:hypothetical protein
MNIVELIPISPRTPDIPFEDMPTVAEQFWPNATAQDALLSESDETPSYGKLWRAWAKGTALIVEM